MLLRIGSESIVASLNASCRSDRTLVNFAKSFSRRSYSCSIIQTSLESTPRSECSHYLYSDTMGAGTFVHWILGQREMATTVTNKPIPAATRAHLHEMSPLYAVWTSDDVWHVPSLSLRCFRSNSSFSSASSLVKLAGSCSCMTARQRRLMSSCSS
jgi:hypothetical protein